VRISISIGTYDYKGKRCLSIFLNNIQKLGEGDRLDNRRSAFQDFDDGHSSDEYDNDYDYDDKPKKRRSDADDDFDDRPKKKRSYDDDEDDYRPAKKKKSDDWF
jgi:hypothetical protein